MFRTALACLFFALPVSSFAVPIPSDSTANASGAGPLAGQEGSGSFDFDDGFVAAAARVVIAYRPALTDSDFSSNGVRYEERSAAPQPGFIDERLAYLGANLTLIGAVLTLIWFLSRYGRRASKRRTHRSARAMRRPSSQT